MGAVLALAAALALPSVAAPAALAATSDAVPAAFTLVGADPLAARGMNSALALDGDVAYVGSRTDAGAGHPHAGVLIVAVADPVHPRLVGEIGGPAQGLPGYSSRELRVWPQQHLLVVLDITCSQTLHACDPRAGVRAAADPYFAFYDITDRLHPALVSTFHTPRTPHEFFLWVDPGRPAERALVFWTSPTASTGPGAVNLTVSDISGWRRSEHTELATFSANDLFTAQARAGDDVRLHSLSVSSDGSRAWLAYLGGGVLALDTASVSAGLPGATLRLLTPVGQRAHWGSPGAHSAVAIPGTSDLLVTDEVYGTAGMVNGGCPWGLARTVDVSDPARPRVLATAGTAEDNPAFCRGIDRAVTTFESFSPHNPTALAGLALVSWHSAGLVALDLSDPARPAVVATVRPDPQPSVATEDPVLGGGPDHWQTWSYPIVRDGLVYVVDIRNGLEVFRYTGPHQDVVSATTFAEGNSNVGVTGAATAVPSAAASSTGVRTPEAQPSATTTTSSTPGPVGAVVGSSGTQPGPDAATRSSWVILTVVGVVAAVGLAAVSRRRRRGGGTRRR